MKWLQWTIRKAANAPKIKEESNITEDTSISDTDAEIII
jgi:hypothetical protein